MNTHLLLSILIPPLGLPLGFHGLSKDFRHWEKYIICLALFLSAFAYAYKPIGNSDLVRYFQNFEDFGCKPFFEAISYSGSTSNGRGKGLYLLYAFYWVIGKIGDYHIAPALTTFVIYYIGFYITCKIGEDFKLSIKDILLYILFITLTLNYHAIVNNIRNIFAFSLLGLAVFRDVYLRKRNVFTLILYVVPVFFHSSALFFVFLRLVIELPKKFKWLYSIVVLSSEIVVSILYENMYRIQSGNFFAELARFTIAKGYGFFSDTSSVWGTIVQNSGSQRLARVLYIGLAVIFCICAISTKRGKIVRTDGRTSVGLEKFRDFAFYTGLVTISCSQMLMPEYWRFVSALILFGSVIFFSSKLEQPSSRLCGILECFVIPIIIGCMALWIRELLKSSETGALLSVPFISSPIFVIITDLVKMMCR